MGAAGPAFLHRALWSPGGNGLRSVRVAAEQPGMLCRIIVLSRPADQLPVPGGSVECLT